MKHEKRKDLRHTRAYYINWIWNEYRPHWRMVLFLLFLTFLSTIIAVLFPMVLKHIIDTLVTGLKSFQAGTTTMEAARSERNRLLLMLLAMGLGPVFSGIYPYFRARMNVTFEMYFREKFFAEILSKGHRFFLKFRTGDLVTRLTEDIRTNPPGLSWLCCSGIFRAVNSASIIFFCVISMTLLHWKLALVACLPLPIMLFIFIKLETSFGETFKEAQEGMSEGNDFLEAAYSGIKIITSFNARKPQEKLYDTLLEKRIGQEIRVDSLWGMFMVFFEFLNYVGEIMVLIFGGIMVIRGSLTLGTYYAFFSYLGMIIYPLMDIPMMLVTLTQACVSIDRLEDMQQADRAWQDLDVDGATEIANIESLSFENVSFRHATLEKLENPDLPAASAADPVEQQPFAFRHLSFTINRGEKVAIVGQIGSGKTTLLNLISGVMKPDDGMVTINGMPLPEIRKQSFRDKIGYIQQEPVIFSESIRTNIDFWRNQSDELIQSCARLAQFEREVMTFPGGYTEPVGQRGVTLSGGQRQRLSIARALVGRPQLLLMDDITASLDAANEKKLWADLNREFGAITCLIVTHRMATAMMADRIIVLKDGGIEATGTHDELLRDCATYRNLSHG
ncbi:MAG TPA: ABC transporter ATP-binding protein [Candidatus Rifleibacterium sp.]|nr:ABC transporter ATP-binding protein [Candidatus Rifleibacterium sp.]HPT46385.1 ABC transporter ATP-binding protein [Candidatus Rifleibacterium sp.]